MKGFYLKRTGLGYTMEIYSGNHCIDVWCYHPFVKKYPHLKLKLGEKIPVDVKITRRKE